MKEHPVEQLVRPHVVRWWGDAAATVLVPPGLAATLLGFNHDPTQRPLHGPAVEHYARSMGAGGVLARFDGRPFRNPDHRLIRFHGDPPTLLDGQHRLHAVVRLGSPVELWVRWASQVPARRRYGAR